MGKNKSGFTIVELLIVIVVIAILAAISFVAYKSIQKRATEATLQSDLRQAKTYLEQQKINTGAYPASTDDIPKSPNTSYELSFAGTSFCLTATTSVSGATPHHVARESGVAAGPCQGHTYGGPAPAGVNIAPPLEQWTLSGGATYDNAAKEITLASIGSAAQSPYIRVDSPVSFAMTIDSYSPAAGHRYSTSSYYDENHSLYTLNSGYSGNGNAVAIPAGAWTPTTWSMGGLYTGPNFKYVQYRISVSASYGIPGMRIRNPSVTLTR